MSDAICEFGWNNIIHLLLFDNLTSEIADIIEQISPEYFWGIIDNLFYLEDSLERI